MASLFHKGLMDLVVKIKDRNILVSNKMKSDEIKEYLEIVKKHYDIKVIEVDTDNIDFNKLAIDKIIRVIPTSITDKVNYIVVTT